MKNRPVVIIGAGPAGLAAAMQLKRQGVDPLVLEQKQVGGLLLNANLVENYPGFVNGISGPDLVKLFKEQADRLGVTVSIEQVKKVSFKDGIFRIDTNLRELQSQILIAASGTIPKELPGDLVTEDVQQDIYYEVFPLIDQIYKDFVIIGAGDAAFDYALNLSRRNRITILNRGSKIKALPLLVERSRKKERRSKKYGIGYYSDVEVSGIYRLKNGRLGVAIQKQGLVFECDYVIAAIGRKPEFSFADPSIIGELDQLLKDQKLFLIGDLQNGSFRQTSIAVADGVRTAMIIDHILEKG